MTKIIVTGAAGRMGQRIIFLAGQDRELQLVGAVEAAGSPAIGQKVGEPPVPIIESMEKVIGGADVVIDFSTPKATLPNLQVAAKAGRPAVIGTTGHTGDQRKEIDALSKKMAIVMAPNMSVGVNLMWKLLDQAARTLGRSSPVRVREIHHVHKKDKPSGTALKILDVLSQALGIPSNSIPIDSLREGEVVGDHQVFFENEAETLEITHRAHSRDPFALGALRAVKWIKGHPPGLYDMQDVLGLKS